MKKSVKYYMNIIRIDVIFISIVMAFATRCLIAYVLCSFDKIDGYDMLSRCKFAFRSLCLSAAKHKMFSDTDAENLFKEVCEYVEG